MTQDAINTASKAATDAAGRGLYVVQFTGPVHDAYKTALTRLGAELGDYLPENAFLVRMDGSLRAKVMNLGFVKGVAAYAPAYKLDRGLAGLSGQAESLVRISTFGSGTKGPVQALSTLGLKPEAIGVGVLTARVDGQRLRSLLDSTDVVYVEPVRANALLNDKAAGVMGVTKAWTSGLDGKGQVVAISDTGLDNGKNDSSLHPDFQGQVKQLTALGRPGDASDTMGHGTHVAGSILGTGAASKGQLKGMASGAKLVFQSVLDSKGGLGGIPDDLGTLFKQAYDAGARIHSNSWGVPAAQGGTTYDAQSAQVDKFMWEHPDYTILFAAGNDGDQNNDGQTDYGTVSTPGTAKNAITVGASQNNRPDKKMATDISAMATFSSRGPTGDGRVKPDVVAPGTWIASTRSSLADAKEFWGAFEGNDKYGYMGGTSMATPLTAGATTVLRQYFVDKLSITPKASLLKASLINGAAAMNTSLSWKDDGWGRVDINNTLYGRPFKFVNEEKALGTGEAQTYSYAVKSGQPFKVTLVWTDYPATPAADKTLVNDLDLTVKGPDGKEILGNAMLGNAVDHTNNVENVVVSAPADGTYTVTVKGYNIPQGPQRFALVASGNVDGGTTVPNPPPTDPNPNPPAKDTQAPKTSISSPTDGAAVSGTVSVTAGATDNVGVSKVIFYVDGQQLNTVATAPYTVAWDSTRVADGTHSLVANAYDAAGNVGISPTVKVKVSNAAAAASQSLQFSGKTGSYGTAGKYYVDVLAPGTVKAEFAQNGFGSVSLAALDPAGKQVATGQDGLSFNAVTTGTYTMVVTSGGGWANYGLKVTYPPVPSTVVESRSGTLSAGGTRYQVYTVNMASAGSLNALVNFADSRADLDLYVVDSKGQVVAQATSPDLDPETLSARLAAGTYAVYVVADSGLSNYQLTIVHPK
ncbi:MAG TPA: S8 family serine peptidase [Symbiobacteriaceae bacterium]|jgi:subtilisin family serine protease